MKFELSYELEDHGWADAFIRYNDKTHYISNISYLSDALSGLSEAILHLLNGCTESECAFEHEPGRTKLRFIRNDEEITIKVYEFKHEMREEDWSVGEIVFCATVSLKRLKSQYLNQVENILSGLGEKGYEESWGAPFPMRLYNEIKRS